MAVAFTEPSPPWRGGGDGHFRENSSSIVAESRNASCRIDVHPSTTRQGRSLPDSRPKPQGAMARHHRKKLRMRSIPRRLRSTFRLPESTDLKTEIRPLRLRSNGEYSIKAGMVREDIGIENSREMRQSPFEAKGDLCLASCLETWRKAVANRPLSHLEPRAIATISKTPRWTLWPPPFWGSRVR